jgi:hypothetical protein
MDDLVAQWIAFIHCSLEGFQKHLQGPVPLSGGAGGVLRLSSVPLMEDPAARSAGGVLRD